MNIKINNINSFPIEAEDIKNKEYLNNGIANSEIKIDSMQNEIEELDEVLKGIKSIVFYDKYEINSIELEDIDTKQKYFTNFLNDNNYKEYKEIYSEIASKMNSASSFFSIFKFKNDELDFVDFNRRNSKRILDIFKKK